MYTRVTDKNNLGLHLLPDGIASIDAMGALSLADAQIGKEILSQISKGHIELATLRVEDDPQSYDKAFLKITPKGIQYLKDIYAEEIPFLADIRIPDASMDMLNGLGNETICQILDENNAEIMFRECRFPTRMDALSITPAPPLTPLHNIIDKAAKQTDDLLTPEEDLEPPRYFNAREILALMEIDDTQSFQNLDVPFVGLCAEINRVYMVFKAGPNGVPWNGLEIRRLALDARNIGLNICGHDLVPLHGVKYGILLVKDAQEFERAYKDPYHKRKAGDPSQEHELGYPFERLYTVPFTKEGTVFLDWLKLCGSNLEDVLILTGNACYQKYDGLYSEIFEYTYENTLLFSGISMDIIAIQRLVRFLEVNDVDFHILCFTWQQEYYSQIFYDVPYRFVNLPMV